MTPLPPWMIDELERERRRRQEEAHEQNVLRIEIPAYDPRRRQPEEAPVTRGPIVIEF